MANQDITQAPADPPRMGWKGASKLALAAGRVGHTAKAISKGLEDSLEGEESDPAEQVEDTPQQTVSRSSPNSSSKASGQIIVERRNSGTNIDVEGRFLARKPIEQADAVIPRPDVAQPPMRSFAEIAIQTEPRPRRKRTDKSPKKQKRERGDGASQRKSVDQRAKPRRDRDMKTKGVANRSRSKSRPRSSAVQYAPPQRNQIYQGSSGGMNATGGGVFNRSGHLHYGQAPTKSQSKGSTQEVECICCPDGHHVKMVMPLRVRVDTFQRLRQRPVSIGE